MYCLDANVWIYYLDADLEEHDAVRQDVGRVLRTNPLFTTTVLQMEVVHYLSNQLAESEEPIAQILSIEDASVAELTTADVQRAASLLADHDQTGIGGRDATVLSAMERHEVTRLWTHDRSLKQMGDRLDWLDVTDPVME